MLSLIFYPIATILLLFFFGYGLTVFFIPKKLQVSAFWLSPWMGIIFLIFTLVISSLAGFSASQVLIPVCIALSICNVVSFIKKRKFHPVNPKEDIIIWLFVMGSLIFNLSPLLLQHKSLTSISLGNNDIIMYANVPDYLTKHTLTQGLFSNSSLAVNHVIKESFRWGPPSLSSFFLSLFNLKGYQFAYVFEAVIFSLTIPLIYIFLKMIYKPSLISLLLSLALTVFNVNLLYIIYHDFFAQVLYWGLTLCFYIFIYSYLEGKKVNSIYNISSFDIVISVLLSVIFLTFSEGMIFIFFPMLVFLFLQFIFRKKLKYYFLNFSKIFLIFFIINSISISNSVLYEINLIFGKEGTGPIGWLPFRASNLYPNPFEIIGLYSIHSFEALPLIPAIIFSLIVICFILYGLRNSKSKILLGSFLFVFLIFYVWTSLIRHHFFFYYRAVTLTLPLLIILFTVGIVRLFRQRRIVLTAVFILIVLTGFSAVKLNKRLLKEHLVVDRTFTTLREIPAKNTQQDPIYTQYRLNNGVSAHWENNWAEYFLNNDKPPAIPPENTNPYQNAVPDNGLLLILKTNASQRTASVILKSPIVWENQYFVLGRLCNSSECLSNRPEDLSEIVIGQSPFEDSLLITGWSAKEVTNRWAAGKESTLRLVTKDFSPTTLSFEAQSLSQPQEVTVYLDGKLLGNKALSTSWQQYIFPIASGISKGVHEIKFTYSNTYKPSQVLIDSLDNRDLAVNFRWIKLQ